MGHINARFAGSGICATIALAGAAWASSATLWPWAESVANIGALLFGLAAVVLFVLGIGAWSQTRPSTIKITTVSNATASTVADPDRKVLRLHVINNGRTGDFRARAWWVHDGMRMHHDPWYVCWSQTADTTVPIENGGDNGRNLNLIFWKRGDYLKPVFPSWPTLGEHADQKHPSDDVYVELLIWREDHKKPTRSRWRFIYHNEQLSLERADEKLPRQPRSRT